MHQVVATDSTFAEMGIGCGAASRNDDRRDGTPKQIKTLV
jgi:hypothetical protein